MPKLREKASPVWKGPEEDGITQSMLGKFLVCRERFRLLVVEGLQPNPQFNHRIEYGNMWHTCEEAWAGAETEKGRNCTGPGCLWEKPLNQCVQNLVAKYPLQREQIFHWLNVCRVQFPVYARYWLKHKERKSVQSLLQEQVFDVPYELPSGRTVRLRGKWDEVRLIGKGRGAGIYLREHKTKGDINEQQLLTQLQFDLQTMFYSVALVRSRKVWCETTTLSDGPIEDKIELVTKSAGCNIPICGIDYNVVRRPLSGGKHSIRQHKPSKANPRGEGSEEFYARLGNLIKGEPEHYFLRWRVEVTPADLERFRREFLDPILEQLCQWWERISWCCQDKLDIWGPTVPDSDSETGDGLLHYWNRLHWRHPYGVRNSLNEGGSSELDEYLATGSELGLERTDQLFEELV